MNAKLSLNLILKIPKATRFETHSLPLSDLFNGKIQLTDKVQSDKRNKSN